ncbi:MAG: phosphohydrolase [Bacteroidetes bacterium GWA2_30_7]|nr:MAG: phosphohydrolase [Bacteroidetes bacterium GWA2_30_7]
MNVQIIQSAIDFAKKELIKYDSGHDWYHTYRVWSISKQIAKKEKADMFVVELAALLHDIADAKFHNGDEEIGPIMASTFLKKNNVSSKIIEQVVFIIRNISFKSKEIEKIEKPIEFQIVQDADRLDAIGAIGIARVFAYGGFRNQKIFDPEIPPALNITKEEYKNHTSTSINHFYEKLLKLKDLMNTETGRALALKRHKFMEKYLEQFFEEWNCII